MALHEHSFIELEKVAHAPCGEGQHTAFVVFGCSCGELHIFPDENYDLAAPEYQAWFSRAWMERGFRLTRGPISE